MDTSKGETPEPTAGETPDPKATQGGDGGKPDPGSETPDISGLKSALDKERAARERAERERKALRDQIGQLITPEKFESVEQQVAALTAERDTAAARALRLEVALEKGLSPSLARRLVGDTAEELAADADELLATIRPSVGTPAAKTGTGDDAGAGRPSIEQLFRAAAGRG